MTASIYPLRERTIHLSLQAVLHMANRIRLCFVMQANEKLRRNTTAVYLTPKLGPVNVIVKEQGLPGSSSSNSSRQASVGPATGDGAEVRSVPTRPQDRARHVGDQTQQHHDLGSQYQTPQN